MRCLGGLSEAGAGRQHAPPERQRRLHRPVGRRVDLRLELVADEPRAEPRPLAPQRLRGGGFDRRGEFVGGRAGHEDGDVAAVCEPGEGRYRPQEEVLALVGVRLGVPVGTVEVGTDQQRRLVVDPIAEPSDEGVVLLGREPAGDPDAIEGPSGRRERRQRLGDRVAARVDPPGAPFVQQQVIEDQRVQRPGRRLVAGHLEEADARI
ncbi:hypothetical protein BRC82_06790 [Halobacteriales archaeon QS_1_67_19]|nr:MAG: hypothetical protein BRC82_06790 [Halobacteriales archaeon QS_1_67_19]